MRSFLFTPVLFLFVHGVLAQEKLSLQQAIETGLKNNYSIVIAKNESEIGKNNSTAGNAGMLPQVNLSLIQNNSVTDTKQKYSTGNEVDRTGAVSHSLNGAAELSWTIFDGFKMFATYNRLKELEAMGELNARLTIENTISEIITAYFDVTRQMALLNVITEAMKISEVKLNIAKTKFEIGIFSKVEYLQTQVDMNAGISAFKKQQILIAGIKVKLNQLLAREVTTEFEVTDSIRVDYTPTYDDLLAKSVKSNTVLLISEKDISISNYYLKELQSQRFPLFNLNGSYNYAKSNSQANFVLENRTTGFNYGFTVTYNLFNGFNLNSQIKNARIDIENRRINFNALRTQLNAELIIAFRNFQSNLELLNLEENNSSLAKENVDLALERFRVGTIDELQLKNAQQSFVEAQNRLLNVQYETKIAETTLKKLSGELIK